MFASTLLLSSLVALAQGGALITRFDINQCLASSGVPQDVKGSDDWNADSAAFNIRIPYTPVAIAVPKTTDHIKKAILCGKKPSIPLLLGDIFCRYVNGPLGTII
ncbi:hypothetical protein PG997_014158 [Apiospora hydei]|uniref:Uncharacterized protein n=1 Tax=Apiospora hydei TaxID=1337664 RepID=A0ABR1UVG2_9PEZI